MQVWYHCYWESCYVAPIPRFLVMCAVLPKKAGAWPGNETSTILFTLLDICLPLSSWHYIFGREDIDASSITVELSFFVCGLLWQKVSVAAWVSRHWSFGTNRRVFPLFCELLEWTFLVDGQYKWLPDSIRSFYKYPKLCIEISFRFTFDKSRKTQIMH